jgi:hypothetical protein
MTVRLSGHPFAATEASLGPQVIDFGEFAISTEHSQKGRTGEERTLAGWRWGGNRLVDV